MHGRGVHGGFTPSALPARPFNQFTKPFGVGFKG